MTLTCLTVHPDRHMTLTCLTVHPDSHMTLTCLTVHPDSHMTLTRLTVDQAARQAYESVIFLELAEDRKSETLVQFKELMVKASLQQYNYSYNSREVRHSSHF